MAVRFDAAGDYLSRSGSSNVLAYNGAYTWMGWFRPVSDLADHVWLSINAGGGSSNADFLRKAATGPYIFVDVWNGGALTYVQGSVYDPTGWNHFALVRESDTVLKGYWNGVLDITNTHASVSARTASDTMYLGQGSGSGDRFDGRVCGVKAWDRALSADEVALEMMTIRQTRFVNLWGLWPMFAGAGERTRDYSGLGRDWTEAGTLTDEDPAPVGWGAPVLMTTTQPPLVRTIPLLAFTLVVPTPTVTLGPVSGVVPKRTLMGVGT